MNYIDNYSLIDYDQCSRVCIITKKDVQSVFEVILWGTEKHVLLMTSFYSQVYKWKIHGMIDDIHGGCI